MRRRTIIIATVLLAVVIITAVVSSKKLVAAFEEDLRQQEEGSIIKDENLERVIRNEINRPEGEIIPEDLISITFLHAFDKDIKDWTDWNLQSTWKAWI